LDPQGAPRQFSDYTYSDAAQKFFARWFWRETHSRLAPMAQVATLIRGHMANVFSYLKDGIINAGLEVVKDEPISEENGSGLPANVEHFKIAIYFHCGGLERDNPTQTKA
jgi:transposase